MRKAIDYINRYQMIADSDKVVVGVSGGADSVCLLLVLKEYQKQKDFQMKVIHIEHGIRGKSSLSDAAFVEKLCMNEHIPFECYHFDIPEIARKNRLTTEEAGRICRYQAFEKAATVWGGAKIAVAHNQNDQAETMLWNMARGSGLRGMSGIHPVRDHIIRPLLGCSRSEIEAYLKQKGVIWCEDETNQDDGYTRNVVRNKILPIMVERLNAATIEHIFQLGEEVSRAEEYLGKITEEKCKECITLDKGVAQIQIARFLDEDEFMRERMVRYTLEQIGCGLKDITRDHIRNIVTLAELQSGKTRQLPNGWKAVRTFDRIVIEMDTAAEMDFAEGQKELMINGRTEYGSGIFITRVFTYENQEIPQNRYTKWLNYDKINRTLMVRTRNSGDFLVINQEGGKKKLKSYLTEIRIPVSERDKLPLICSGQEVLWVTGYRISEGWKVESDTKKILEITYKEVQDHGRTY